MLHTIPQLRPEDATPFPSPPAPRHQPLKPSPCPASPDSSYLWPPSWIYSPFSESSSISPDLFKISLLPSYVIISSRTDLHLLRFCVTLPCTTIYICTTTEDLLNEWILESLKCRPRIGSDPAGDKILIVNTGLQECGHLRSRVPKQAGHSVMTSSILYGHDSTGLWGPQVHRLGLRWGPNWLTAFVTQQRELFWCWDHGNSF